MKKLFIPGVAILLIAVGTATASAHTVLIASTTLKFADPLLTLGKRAINLVVVTDPKNTVITSGHNLVKGAVLTDPIVDANPLNGMYKVSYRVSAQDGHIVTGAFSFTLQN